MRKLYFVRLFFRGLSGTPQLIISQYTKVECVHRPQMPLLPYNINIKAMPGAADNSIQLFFFPNNSRTLNDIISKIIFDLCIVVKNIVEKF